MKNANVNIRKTIDLNLYQSVINDPQKIMGGLKAAILTKRDSIHEVSNSAKWVYAHLYDFEFNTNLYVGFIYNYADDEFIFEIDDDHDAEEVPFEKYAHDSDQIVIFYTLLHCGKSLKQVVLHPRMEDGSDVTQSLKQGYDELVCEMRKCFKSELELG